MRIDIPRHSWSPEFYSLSCNQVSVAYPATTAYVEQLKPDMTRYFHLFPSGDTPPPLAIPNPLAMFCLPITSFVFLPCVCRGGIDRRTRAFCCINEFCCSVGLSVVVRTAKLLLMQVSQPEGAGAGGLPHGGGVRLVGPRHPPAAHAAGRFRGALPRRPGGRPLLRHLHHGQHSLLRPAQRPTLPR